MKAGYTHITLILDRSGSMSSILNDVVGGVDRFIEEQKKQPGECTLTLVQFDSQAPYETLVDFKPISEAKSIKETYAPRGGTPLYDAIGMGIVDIGARLGKMPEDQRPDKVVFVTMTDGEENQSREYSKAKIAEMVNHQESAYNWQFVYLGANQDAMAVGASIGTQMAKSATYNLNNFQGAAAMTSAKLSTYRSTGVAASLNYTAEDRGSLTSN